MTDIVAQAREAREKLASALALLQNPEAGNLIDTVAEPVARAMGALHQVESSSGGKLADNAPVALDAVRGALGALQAQPQSAIADQATEIIAGSLGLIHGLAEQSKAAAPAEPAPTPAPAPATEQAPTQPAGGLDKTQLASDPPPAAAAQVSAHIPANPAPAAPSGALDATLPTPTRPEAMQQNVALDSTQASVRTPDAGPGIAAPTQESARSPVIEPQPEPVVANRNSKMASAPEKGKPEGAVEVEANLGAHSPTNFYKGLSGNDVVDDGGLFVATYDIPPLGTVLWVSVHMPGGYEFQGVAEVRWTRETGAGDAPPGFGCAFKAVTDEARKLIYRYVRNREPLFHDDL